MTKDQLRKQVEEALKAGMSQREFIDSIGMSQAKWYAMKPHGFKWQVEASKLGMNKKRGRKKSGEYDLTKVPVKELAKEIFSRARRLDKLERLLEKM